MNALSAFQPSQRQIKDLLDLGKWAEDFTSMQVDQISPYFIPYIVKAGTPIIKEGVRCSFICLICEGEVEVVKESSTGGVKKLQTFGSGKVLGEMSFFDLSAASATVVVKKDADVLVMTETNYKTLCEQYPKLALTLTIKLMRIISQRLRQTSGKLVDLI